MEPLLIILIPGLVGGLGLAALIFSHRINLPGSGVDRQLAPPSPSLINMAHIRVEGGGGLGLVAAVLAVAIADPRIRVAVGLAALLGVGLAVVLIAWHRREPLDSVGHGPSGHSMLGLEERTEISGRTRSDDPVRARMLRMPAWNPR